MEQKWRFEPHDQQLVELIERNTGVSPLLARLLASRKITDPAAIKNFLQSSLKSLQDPTELTGTVAAAGHILQAIKEQKKIVVHGDYDADGMTGAAILVRCISMLNGNVSYFVPNRLEEGYGLSEPALRDLIERGAELIISVDCGIASVAEAAFVKSQGAELIITDHHQYGDELPDAAVIVHPSLPGCVYPHAPLCGAGVAFKVAWEICKQANQADKVAPAHRDFLLAALGLAAIGTVADVVPLIGENRVIVRHGLLALTNNPLPGLQQLIERSKLTEKRSISSEDIAFGIAPRLNAAGRLGQAELGIELLVSDAPERCAALAEYIEGLNVTRDKLQRAVNKEATQQIEDQFDPTIDAALVLDGRGWHAGVIGIVAGKIAERYHTPTVIISRSEAADSIAVGSARSVGLINLHHAFQQCTETLIAHGGHAAAAGLKVDESQIDAFREAFLEYVSSESAPTDRVPSICIDIEAIFSQLTVPALYEIEKLSPFGAANPRPIFCSMNVQLAAPPRKIGNGERHLSVQFVQHGCRIRGVAFGHAEWADLFGDNQPLDIVYRPMINEYQGRRSAEIQLIDWRHSQIESRV
jgi:single-stranded-DNA-specific exonuclease